MKTGKWCWHRQGIVAIPHLAGITATYLGRGEGHGSLDDVAIPHLAGITATGSYDRHEIEKQLIVAIPHLAGITATLQDKDDN